jgi:hypothetical protein
LNNILLSGWGLTKSDVLELNLTCLFGENRPPARVLEPYVEEFQMNIGKVWREYKRSASMPASNRAALIYSRFVSHPQPLNEGNKRAGLLMACYILAKAGLKPFFLTPANAENFIDISSQLMDSSRLLYYNPAASVDTHRYPDMLKADLAEMFRKHSASAPS